jgi:hypothetical protein
MRALRLEKRSAKKLAELDKRLAKESKHDRRRLKRMDVKHFWKKQGKGERTPEIPSNLLRRRQVL